MPRYWVGGNGTWDSSDTTHWSASSGGAGGASVPTTSDDVHFDTSSTTSLVQKTGALACLDLICEGTFTGRFQGSGTINCAGSLTYKTGMGISTDSGVITFSATALGKTITVAGQTTPGFTFNGVGGGWALQDAVITTGTITVTNGAFNSNSKSITCGAISSNNSNIRTVTMDGSAVTFGGGLATCFQLGTTSTGLTWSAVGTTWVLTTLSSTNYAINLGGATNLAYGTSLNFGGTGTGNISFAFGGLTLTTISHTRLAAYTINFSPANIYTITTWSISGRIGYPVTIQSGTAATAFTLVKAGGGQVNAEYLIVKDSTASPTETWVTHGIPSSTANVSGNTAWTFSPRTVASNRQLASSRVTASGRTMATNRVSAY